jgi:hypothetical protein
VSTPALWLLGLTGLNQWVSLTPSPRHPASISLPAGPGSVDTSHAREPPALPTSAPSGSRTAHSLPYRPRRLLPGCPRHALVQSAYSLARKSLPTLVSTGSTRRLRRIFLRLVPGMSRRSALLPQASPASGKRQSLYPKVSAFLVHPANCSSYSSLSLFGPSWKKNSSSTASADSCHLSLLSRTGLPLRLDDRSPQVRTLTFPVSLPNLLLRLLVASGFVVYCQLTLPHSLSLGLCSSSHRFSSGFLQTSPHGHTLAFR